jgi:hypothetical protein
MGSPRARSLNGEIRTKSVAVISRVVGWPPSRVLFPSMAASEPLWQEERAWQRVDNNRCIGYSASQT